MTQDHPEATVSPLSGSGSGDSDAHPEPVSVGPGSDNIIINTSIASSVTGSENTVIAAANGNNENIQVGLP